MENNGNGYTKAKYSDVLNPMNIGGEVGDPKGVITPNNKKQGPSYSTASFPSGDYLRYKRLLEKRDYKQAIQRFEWIGLPEGLDSIMIERILYYRGQGMFFTLQDKFYFLPYTLNGTIDVYGRYINVTPLPFNGVAEIEGDKSKHWIPGLTREVAYDLFKEYDNETCVILSDSSLGYNQTNIPLFIENKPFIEDLSKILVLIQTNLENSVKQFIVFIKDEAEIDKYSETFETIRDNLLQGGPNISFVKSAMDVQELKGTQALQTKDYWTSFQSLDNLRQTLMGISNNGVINKKERMLVSEQDISESESSLLLRDNLYNRKRFCQLVNNQFGLMIDVIDTQNEMEIYGDGEIGLDEYGNDNGDGGDGNEI